VKKVAESRAATDIWRLSPDCRAEQKKGKPGVSFFVYLQRVTFIRKNAWGEALTLQLAKLIFSLRQ